MLNRFWLMPALAAAVAVTGCQQAPTVPATNNAATAQISTAPTVATAQGVPTGGTCGTVAGLTCTSRGDFCKTAVNQCQVADAAGTCTKKPEVCTKEYRPVCGCDGKTYGNACEADAKGVNVQTEGECAKS